MKMAGDYCVCVEKVTDTNAGEFFLLIQQHISLIYHKAACIKRPKYCYDEDIKKFVSESRYTSIRDAIAQQIGKITAGIPVSAGSKHDQTPHIGFALSEALADIYESLKEFISLYQVGIPQSMNDALWHLKNDFAGNLGLRLIEGLQLIHTIVYSNQSSEKTYGDFDDAEGTDESNPWSIDDQEEIYSEDE